MVSTLLDEQSLPIFDHIRLAFLCLDILAALVVHCQTNQSLKLKIFGIFERLLSS